MAGQYFYLLGLNQKDTEYVPYSIQIPENTDQQISKHGHFSCSPKESFARMIYLKVAFAFQYLNPQFSKCSLKCNSILKSTGNVEYVNQEDIFVEKANDLGKHRHSKRNFSEVYSQVELILIMIKQRREAYSELFQTSKMKPFAKNR